MTPEQKKIVSLSTGIGFIVLAAGILGYTNWPEKKFAQNLMFFSDDDGKTWYADSVDKLPPYQHNGKDAVGAVVFSYAGGSKQFCGFLFRFPPNLKTTIEAQAKAPGKTIYGIAYASELGTQREVKAPLSPGPWVMMGSPTAATLTAIKSPDGSELDQVLP